MNKSVFRLIFISDLFGQLYGRPTPDKYTKSGKSIINICSSPGSPTSSDTPGKYLLKGGLPRIQRKIREILKFSNYDEIMIVSSGSMINGTAETLFSQGQIMIKAMNKIGTKDNKIEYHVPGLYDYVYGSKIFDYVYGNSNDDSCFIDSVRSRGCEKIRAKTLALNLYRHNKEPVLLGYDIKEFNNFKIGIIGLTINQKSQILNHDDYIVDGNVNKSCMNQRIIDDKLISTVIKLKKCCDLVILISNFGFAANVRLAELEQLDGYPIDIILSSGTQETFKKVVNKTLIHEIGSYGQNIGMVKVDFLNNKLISMKSKIYPIGPYVKENLKLKRYIDRCVNNYFPPNSILEVPSLNTKDIYGHNGIDLDPVLFNQRIMIPRDEIFPSKGMSVYYVGKLINRIYFGSHRQNYLSHPLFPSIIEGSSSNLIAECIRSYTKCQIGIVRGFKTNMCVESYGNLSYDREKINHGYGSGCLTKYDIFDSFPIPMYLGRAFITGKKIKEYIQNTIYTSLHNNIYNYHGEYVAGFSGLKIKLDPSVDPGTVLGPAQIKFSSISVLSRYNKNIFGNEYIELDLDQYYSFASHMDLRYPTRLNNIIVDYPPDSANPLYKPIPDDKPLLNINNIVVLDKNKNDNSLIHPAMAVYQYLESLDKKSLQTLLYNISKLKNIQFSFNHEFSEKLIHNFK